MSFSLEQEISWNRRHMVRTEQALARLPSLAGLRIAGSIHLEAKLASFLTGLRDRGADLFLTTCNRDTVRDEFTAHMRGQGLEVQAACGMSNEEVTASRKAAHEWGPTHLLEMGAHLTTHLAEGARTDVRGSVECTGSGLHALARRVFSYPVFDADSLPIKAGIHNRHMVGTATWHTFLQVTRLSLHGQRVLVLGHGAVGQGVADTARTQGAVVRVVEPEPGRRTQATFKGMEVVDLLEGLPWADIVVTATGRPGVLGAASFPLLKDGAFLLNVGH